MTHAIRAEALTKYFPRSGRLGLRALLAGLAPEERFTAVDGVDLDVQRGEVLGVLGRNGAGKSTLLRLVGGIHAADRGWVAVNGDVAALFELGGVGNVQLTGREFAHRYLQLFGVRRARRDAVVSDIHEFSELREYFDEKIHTYSAGMGARLYFAAATAIPHEIYLIDEILSVGDEHFQAKSWARVRERLREGASGLLVTHDWSAVIKLCRRSLVLERGRVSRTGRSDEVVAGYLDLQPAPADRVRIGLAPGECLQAQAGRDCELRVPIEVLAPGEVHAAVSIDVLQLGFGWETVILTEFVPVGGEAGRHVVSIRIPALPLAPGEYSLNFFLSTPADPATGIRESLDRRSWTSGDGMLLRVSGAPADGVAPFPVRWREAAE